MDMAWKSIEPAQVTAGNNNRRDALVAAVCVGDAVGGVVGPAVNDAADDAVR